MYVVYFDDGTMLGTEPKRYVREFPDARKFTSKRAAEAAMNAVSKPGTVEEV